tara:strand:+ start:2527 stop:2688 length:162 start_codon:yes stop_codon:yes gene_type:complete
MFTSLSLFSQPKAFMKLVESISQIDSLTLLNKIRRARQYARPIKNCYLIITEV